MKPECDKNDQDSFLNKKKEYCLKDSQSYRWEWLRIFFSWFDISWAALTVGDLRGVWVLWGSFIEILDCVDLLHPDMVRLQLFFLPFIMIAMFLDEEYQHE